MRRPPATATGRSGCGTSRPGDRAAANARRTARRAPRRPVPRSSAARRRPRPGGPRAAATDENSWDRRRDDVARLDEKAHRQVDRLRGQVRSARSRRETRPRRARRAAPRVGGAAARIRRLSRNASCGRRDRERGRASARWMPTSGIQNFGQPAEPGCTTSGSAASSARCGARPLGDRLARLVSLRQHQRPGRPGDGGAGGTQGRHFALGDEALVGFDDGRFRHGERAGESPHGGRARPRRRARGFRCAPSASPSPRRSTSARAQIDERSSICIAYYWYSSAKLYPIVSGRASRNPRFKRAKGVRPMRRLPRLTAALASLALWPLRVAERARRCAGSPHSTRARSPTSA